MGLSAQRCEDPSMDDLSLVIAVFWLLSSKDRTHSVLMLISDCPFKNKIEFVCKIKTNWF